MLCVASEVYPSEGKPNFKRFRKGQSSCVANRNRRRHPGRPNQRSLDILTSENCPVNS